MTGVAPALLDLHSRPVKIIAKDGTDWVRKGFFRSRRRATITLILHEAQEEECEQDPDAPPRLRSMKVTFVPDYIRTVGDLWANALPPRYAPQQPCDLEAPIIFDRLDVFFNDAACDSHALKLTHRKKIINDRMEQDFKAFLFSQLSNQPSRSSIPSSSYTFL